MPAHPARSVPPRRSPVEWGIRGVIAVGTLVVGTAAVTHALGYSLRATDPERAYALSSHDGRVGAILSEVLSGPDANAAARAKADRIAQRALRQDPTAVTAVATLGINAQVRGDTKTARRIFAYADQLSRRDLRTRLWEIEDAVQRNDIPNALRNYDIALRTSRFAPPLLYPVLNEAIVNDDVADALVRMLAKRPPWGDGFLNQAALGENPAAAAALLRKARRARVAVPPSADTMVIDALANARRYDAAWTHYAAVTDADRQRSRDPRFDTEPTSPSLFDWKPVLDDPGVTATLRRGGFDYAVSPMGGGAVLQQTQMLRPGSYTLSGRATGIDPASGGRGYWEVRCTDGRELVRVPLPSSTEEGGFAGRFSVPTDCPTQSLRLMIQGGGQSTELSGQVIEIQVRPQS